MKCDRLRDLIADYVDGECGLLVRLRIDKKIASCRCCAETFADEKRLRSVLATWSDEEPSEKVWHRIRSMAAPALSASVEPPASWRSFLAGLGRQAVPYMLGAATAVLIMVGGGFERDEGVVDEPTATIELPRPAATLVHDDSRYAATEVSLVDPVSGTIRSARGAVFPLVGLTTGNVRTGTASRPRRTH